MNAQVKQFLQALTPTQQRKYFAKFNAERLSYPYNMVRVALPENLPEGQQALVAQWRSRFFIANVWATDERGSTRITVHRIEMDKEGNWKPGISLEDLRGIQEQIGFGGYNAFAPLGVYPHNIYTLIVHGPRQAQTQ